MGSLVLEPAFLVKVPALHFVCSIHNTSFVSANLFVVGACARKKPLPQALHCVSRVDVPAASVHSPREQFLCTPVHATTSDASLDLFTGASNLNLPLLQAKHWVSDVTVPDFAVHSPAEHFRCSLHTTVSSSSLLAGEWDARNRPKLQFRH